jgi:hypothetical protein
VTKAELEIGIAAAKTELKADIAAKTELKADIAGLRHVIERQTLQLTARLGGLIVFGIILAMLDRLGRAV